MSLLRSTKNLLNRQRRAGRTLADIHQALGGKVEREWFYKFAAGKIDNPGVKTIQTLHDTLQKIDAPQS